MELATWLRDYCLCEATACIHRADSGGDSAQPFTRSTISLFDGKKRYLIPLYQRQYAWKPDPQLKLLWEDIERAVDRLNHDRSSLTPHFMGAIVIAQIKTFGKQVQAYEVIDGQQRLTTFQLLLSARPRLRRLNGYALGRLFGRKRRKPC